MDPQKVEELNENLFQLNQAVRETDNTFMDVLGPMASRIKEQIKKENTQAANNQDEITNQLQATYTRSQIVANKQNEIFKRQLARRGYEIDAIGKEIKVESELSKSQIAQLEKLDKAIIKERELVQATDKPIQKFREISGSVNSLEGLLGKLEDKMFEMTGKSVGGAIALQASIAALTGVAKAFGSMTEAIYRGERGASVGAKGYTELSDALTKAAFGIGAALMILPGGILIKIAGAAITALAAAAEGAANLIEKGAKLNDDLYNSYNELSQKGVTTAAGMNGLYDSLHKVGLASAHIEKFNKILGENSRDMAIFGGTVDAGAKKFQKVANAIATPTSAINKQFLLMGINADSQREHIMKYMSEEERLGLAKDLSDGQQITNAKKYIENLDKLSMLTGANRKELEEARASVMANENLRAAIFEAEQDKSEEGKARLAELKRFYEAAAMLQATGDTRGATGLAEYAAGRGITGQASAVAFIQFGGKGGLIDRAKKGGSTADLMQAANAGYQRQMDMMADTARIGGDYSGLMTGKFGQGQEFNTRIKELEKKAKEGGFTSVTEYIEAEQEAKKNSKDKTTQVNAEVIQLQEQASMHLDDAAKLMDGAGLAMAGTMKHFNSAVELFDEATRKVAKEKGIEPDKKVDQESLNKEIKQLKDALRIKSQSLDNLDPKIQMNSAYIARLKSEIDTINSNIKSAEERKKQTAPLIPPEAATAEVPQPNLPQAGPGVQVASTTRGLTSTKPASTPDAVLTFGSKSGSKSNFEALSDSIKNRIINAAQEFNAMTGNKIKINSAKRDSEDQQRVWDESVKAGRPGIGPTGMPIGRPGRSKHEQGLAVDIQNYNDPNAVAAMNKQGLFQTVKNDPVHFEAAQTGAMFEGPKDGYFVQLHGKEFVGNEQQLMAIKELILKAKQQGLVNGETSPVLETAEFDSEESAMIIEKFTSMMETKADELLEKIKFGNRVDEDLLNYSQG